MVRDDTEAPEICDVLTMIVKAAPRFATILCRWFGRLAMPIGEADSIDAGAILDEFSCAGGDTVCDRGFDREG